MTDKKNVTLAPSRGPRDPFVLLRQMAAELDRAFEEPFWPTRGWPTLRVYRASGARDVGAKGRCVRKGQSARDQS